MSPPLRHPSDPRIGPKAARALIVFFLAWAAVVGGYYLWRGTRRTQSDLGMRLQSADPKTVQDATIELAARMKQHDPEAKRWYPTLVDMSDSESAEQRGVVAWVMANDPENEEFHRTLTELIKDPAPSVRANAAVSLDKFKDPAGHQALIEMLQDENASSDQLWEALRALRVIGTKEDLGLVTTFASSADKRVQEAAAEAAQGIRDR